MNHVTKQNLIAFETRMKEAFERGELPYLLHLSGGNEDQLIQVFAMINEEDWVFSTHRSHYHYLLKGGSPDRLEQLIREGRSMFIFDRHLRFFTSSLVAGCACIAVGVAESQRRRFDMDPEHYSHEPAVWCFLGDAGMDEGHFYEAVRRARAKGLKIAFVIEDNDRSVESTKLERWGEFDRGDYLGAERIVRIPFTPTYPHAGTGCKHRITFKT